MALTKITATNIGANAVANSIGYTPANRAGDTFTGAIIVNTTNGSPPFTAGRVNSDSEGGQIDFCRSSDNAAAWGIDVYGNTSTPSFRFIDNSASATRMQIDSGGRVTMPYQPYARVSKNNGNIGYNSVIVFNYADDDVMSIYNSTTGRFTAPVAGRYLSMHGMFTASGNSCWLKWRVNGTTIASTYTSLTSGYTSIAGSIAVKMNAGDYLDLWIDSGTSSYAAYGNDRIQCWSVFMLVG